MDNIPTDRRLTVLLVDDDAIVRQAIEQGLLNEPRLQARGVKTLRASDGKRALAQIRREIPDVAVVDLFMPKMDGFELCRALRADPSTRHLPLVVMSGVFTEDEKVRVLMDEVGACFIAKPATATQMADAILNQLASGEAARGVQTGAASPDDVPTTAAPVPEPPPTTAQRDTRHHTIPGLPPTPPPPAGAPTPPPVQSPSPAPAAPRAPDAEITKPNDAVVVAHLLMDHLEAGDTGTLVLRRGQMRKEIFLVRGKPISAMSNLRQEALGSLLVTHGIMDEEQLAFLIEEMKRQKEKMGAVLVSLGWLSPEDVLRYLAAQARKRVADSLRYTGVNHEFIPGDEFLEREIEHDLDVPRLYFSGLQKTATPDVLIETLPRDHGTSQVVTTARFARHRDLLAEVFGREPIEILAGNPRVAHMVTRPDVVATLLPALEAMTLCGLATLNPVADVDPELGPVPKLLQDAARSSMALESLGETIKASSAALSALEIDLEKAGVRSERLDEALDSHNQGAVPTVADIDESGVVTVEAIANVARAGLPATLAPPKPNEQRALVLQEYLALHAGNYYQLLDVQRTATIDEIVAAYEIRTRQFASDVFAGVDLGADAAKLDVIRSTYTRAFRVLTDSRLRAAYDAKQGQQQAEDVATLDAELAFGEARLALDDGRPADAIAGLQTAIAAAPKQAYYRAFLGWALFKAQGVAAAEKARLHLGQALALDPDQVDAHDFLGQLAAATGDEETARKSLERTLDLDPTRLHCLQLLVPIYASCSEFHATERTYKRLIRSLGDRHTPLRQRLWHDLATLYHDEFDDHAAARIAFEMAARLAPDDVDLQRKVIELNAHDLDRWQDIARALNAEWRLRPGDGQLGAALIDLLLRVGKHDAAALAAAAMVLRGLATPEQQALAERSCPRLLTRISQPIEGAILGRIRHANEDSDIETLFALLATTGIIAPFADAEVGVFGQPARPDDGQSQVFWRVLDYTCEILKVKAPQRVFPMDSLGGDARLADTRPPILFVGPELLASSDTVELGFRLGRSMSFGTAGRLTGAARSGRTLKPYLLAVMAFARQALSQGEFEVVPIVEQIERTETGVRKRLQEIGQRLARNRSAINLSGWTRTLNRTATRLGLLICGDLLRAGRIVADEEGPEALDDLLEFALSLDHFDLREELGVSQVA